MNASDGAAPGGVRTLRAAHLWLAPGRVHSPGEVVLDAAGRIVRAGPTTGRRPAPWLLVPGLVDAHVHLQLPALPRAPRAFVPWLQAVIRQRPTGAAAVARTDEALQELLRSGCTAVGEIDSLGSSPARLRRAGFAGRCYQEVLGFDLDAAAAAALVRARAQPGSRGCPTGLSPHAPYSCSADVVRAARRAASYLTVHVAEDAAEVRLLRDGGGPLRTLLERLGRWSRRTRPQRRTPVQWLRACGVLDRRTLLVHLQVASRRDLELVRAHGAPVVVCPPTIDYFRREPPDVPAWRRAGIVVALGTDSRASSRAPLSMVGTIALARRMWPALAPAAVLEMATASGGRALGRPGLGRMGPGGRGDFCAFGLGDRRMPLETALDAATRGTLPVVGTWLCGRRVFSRESATGEQC